MAASRTALICGGRFGIWYATLTSFTTGLLPPSLLLNVSRYCRKRADGDLIGRNSSAGTSSVHPDHPFSAGSLTFPLRVEIISDVACGNDPRSWILPKRLIWVASSTALVYVPLLA